MTIAQVLQQGKQIIK